MKNRQFIVLVIIIIAQTLFFYFNLQEIKEGNNKNYTEIILNAQDLNHIKNTTDQTLEITAKTANWIY